MLFFFFLLEEQQHLLITGIFFFFSAKPCHLKFIKAVSKLCFDSGIKYQFVRHSSGHSQPMGQRMQTEIEDFASKKWMLVLSLIFFPLFENGK